MKKLGIMANCSKPGAAEVVKRLVGAASALGLRLYADEDTAKLAKGCKGLSPAKLFATVDAIVALGGDGTMLRVVRWLEGRDKPVMGFNIGSLGFMTSVAEKDMAQALKALAENDFLVSMRSIVEAKVIRKTKELARYRALNDIVMERSVSARILTLDVSVDDDCVTSYACDGLIVSTPTGSTGHSMSAGGPIVTPQTRALVISLICPHSLSSRPLVIPDTSVIAIEASEAQGEFNLTVDGQIGQPLKQGDRIEIKRSRNNVRFIHLRGHSYFAVLRQKLHWRGSSL